MKTKDDLKTLRGKNVKVLLTDLNDNYKKLRLANFNIKFRKQKNIKESKSLKKQIAKIWTIINEKLIAEE